MECNPIFVSTIKVINKMTNLKIKNNATESVIELFTKINGYKPNNIKIDGSFYWADQEGFSKVGKFIIKNNLYNG
jgi:hypothetical protein